MKGITINGRHFSPTQALQLAEDKLVLELPEWKTDFYTFLKNWYVPGDSITVNTSGSTGQPKAIQHAKTNMLASAQMTLNFLNLKPGQTALLSLSAAYIAGKMMIVRAIEGELNLLTSEPASNPLQHIDQPVDFTAWVPLQMDTALRSNSPEVEAIGTIILGGGPVPQPLQQKIETLQNSVYETFGTTETISHVAMRRLSGENAETEFHTVHEDILLSTDDRSCLVIDAPMLYNGQLVTNDVVELIDEHSFRWLGRADNVINSGGIKLHPEQIEARLATVISQRFFVAGLPDDKLGQRLVLVIEGDTLPEQLFSEIKLVVDKYEIPKAVFYSPKFRETPTGKIQRNETLSELLDH